MAGDEGDPSPVKSQSSFPSQNPSQNPTKEELSEDAGRSQKSSKSQKTAQKAESVAIARALAQADPEKKMTDTAEWFGFFGPDKDHGGTKGRYSKEALCKEFGDVLCLPPIVARKTVPQCFRFCLTPNAPGHGPFGQAHNVVAINAAKEKWAKFVADGTDKDFYKQV